MSAIPANQQTAFHSALNVVATASGTGIQPNLQLLLGFSDDVDNAATIGQSHRRDHLSQFVSICLGAQIGFVQQKEDGKRCKQSLTQLLFKLFKPGVRGVDDVPDHVYGTTIGKVVLVFIVGFRRRKVLATKMDIAVSSEARLVFASRSGQAFILALFEEGGGGFDELLVVSVF